MEYSGRGVLVHLYDTGLRDLEKGKTLSKLREDIFILMFEQPELEYSDIAKELSYGEGTIKNNGSYVFNKISIIIGIQINKRSNYKQHIIDYLYKAIDDSKDIIGVLKSQESVKNKLNNLKQYAKTLSEEGVSKDDMIKTIRDL